MDIIEHQAKVQVLQQEGMCPYIWQPGHLFASVQKGFSTAKGHLQVIEMTPQQSHHPQKWSLFYSLLVPIHSRTLTSAS